MGRFVQLVVEAEVALVLRRDLAGPGVTPPAALQAIEGATPALELVDFRYSGKPTGIDWWPTACTPTPSCWGGPSPT